MDFEPLPEVISTNLLVHVNNDFELTEANENFLEFASLPGWSKEHGTFNAENIGFMDEVQVERITQRMWEAKSTGKLRRELQLRLDPDGNWIKVDSYFAKTMEGVAHRAIITDLNSVYVGWPSRIKKGRLHINKRVSLSPLELTILHYYATGLSAKQTAELVNRSIPAIEACLRRLKEKMSIPGFEDLSLTAQLHRRRLLGFLVTTPQWGDPHKTYHAF